MKLSVIIPAHNEAESIGGTVAGVSGALRAANVPHEILVVNDHSCDRTAEVLTTLAGTVPELRWVENRGLGRGFGHAVRRGLESFAGDAACIVMADASDDPADIVQYYRKLQEGYECVFGSRFVRGSVVCGYPPHKLVLNRLANGFIKLLFGLPFSDVTNAFKCYRRNVIEGIQPLLACHFNLTVEMPLKAIVRGYSYAVIPINWRGRLRGVSKLRIQEMGSRYLFIVLYVWLEKLLARGDYRRADAAAGVR